MWIVLEGANGAGTTTITNKLLEDYPNAIVTRNPGSTPVGAQLRKMLKYGDFNLSAQEQLLLFATDALAFYGQYVGKHDFLICDRINLVSMLAYQYVAGVNEKQFIKFIDLMIELGWTQKIDILFLFNITWDVCESRISKPNLIDADKEHGDRKDNFESQGNTFMEKVCGEYARLSANTYRTNNLLGKLVNKVVEVDATKSIEEVYSTVKSYL